MIFSYSVHWTISWITLVVANYLWSLHDWYLWDETTKELVLHHFKDWHNLKSLMLLFFGLSVWFIPIQPGNWKGWFPIVCWLLLRWFSWEGSCTIIPKSKPYQGASKPWLGNVFLINNIFVATGLSVGIIVVGYLVH